MSDQKFSASTTIAAPPDKVFAVVADTTQHPVIDGSGTVKQASRGGRRLTRKGDRFGMGMRLGVPYLMLNQVVEFEQDRLIAWRHPGLHRWRYTFEPTEDGGTLVTETFDHSHSPFSWVYERTGALAANRKSIPRTLANLKQLVETGAVSR